MRVVGTVVEEESDRPLEGLVVRAYDKDLVFDDKLGSVQTNAKGEFEIAYTETQFRDFNETQPDLYLKVFDASGRRVVSTGTYRSEGIVLELDQAQLCIVRAMYTDGRVELRKAVVD